jgi:hypothetical protein
VRPLGAALAVAFAALVIPSTLPAQQPIVTQLPAHPAPPAPHVRPPYRPGNHSNRYRDGSAAILIDRSMIDRYLPPTAPLPPAPKSAPRPKGGPDVFAEYSSTDASR